MDGDDDDDNDIFDRRLGQLHLREGERECVIPFNLCGYEYELRI